jgi:hypothetical protein
MIELNVAKEVYRDDPLLEKYRSIEEKYNKEKETAERELKSAQETIKVSKAKYQDRERALELLKLEMRATNEKLLLHEKKCDTLGKEVAVYR